MTRAAPLGQSYELVDVNSLEQHPDNPRRGRMASIADSVRENGFYGALIVQRSTRRVLAGNHRLMAAHEEGLEQIPVLFVDVDDDRARRILLVDNRSNDMAGYDDEQLTILLQDLAVSDGGLNGTGYSDADLAELLAEHTTPVTNTDPDAVPVAPRLPRAAEGDVWLLGPHRLACGDSTDLTVVQAALDGVPADLLVTDPPYGVDYTGKTKDALKINNDALTPEALLALLIASLGNARTVMADGSSYYVFSPPRDLETVFRNALVDLDLPIRSGIVWMKDRFVLGHGDYHLRHETILYGWKPGAAHSWYGGRKQDSVWEVARPARSKDHPTMKPVALLQRAVENSTKPGQRVLDVFGGSGSTLITCHQAQRVASLVELDPRYVDVICRRYQEHTGTLPILEASGEAHDFTEGE